MFASVILGRRDWCWDISVWTISDELVKHPQVNMSVPFLFSLSFASSLDAVHRLGTVKSPRIPGMNAEETQVRL